MPFFSNPFDNKVELATDENKGEEDWSIILDICDEAKTSQSAARSCYKSIMKRLNNKNPHIVLHTLELLNACVKNADIHILSEIASKDFVAEARKIIKDEQNGISQKRISTKMKTLIRSWSKNEFKNDESLSLIPSLYKSLKYEGVSFHGCDSHPSKSLKKKVLKNVNFVASQEEEEDIAKALSLSMKEEERKKQSTSNNTILHPMVEGVESVGKPSQSQKVRAIYDFEAVEENELSFKSGDLIGLLDFSDDNWWKGVSWRGEGLFPANFVTFHLTDDKTSDELVKDEGKDINDGDSEVVEDAIDETTINACLEQLQNADPTTAFAEDEANIIATKEDQCRRMAPLINLELQRIDKEFSSLMHINSQLHHSLNLYHSLMNPSNPSHHSFIHPPPHSSIHSSPYSSIHSYPNSLYPTSLSSSTVPSLYPNSFNPQPIFPTSHHSFIHSLSSNPSIFSSTHPTSLHQLYNPSMYSSVTHPRSTDPSNLQQLPNNNIFPNNAISTTTTQATNQNPTNTSITQIPELPTNPNQPIYQNQVFNQTIDTKYDNTIINSQSIFQPNPNSMMNTASCSYPVNPHSNFNQGYFNPNTTNIKHYLPDPSSNLPDPSLMMKHLKLTTQAIPSHNPQTSHISPTSNNMTSSQPVQNLRNDTDIETNLRSNISNNNNNQSFNKSKDFSGIEFCNYPNYSNQFNHTQQHQHGYFYNQQQQKPSYQQQQTDHQPQTHHQQQTNHQQQQTHHQQQTNHHQQQTDHQPQTHHQQQTNQQQHTFNSSLFPYDSFQSNSNNMPRTTIENIDNHNNIMDKHNINIDDNNFYMTKKRDAIHYKTD